ncbi:polyprenyl synthetase family protein [Microbacterium karelineae]|uniref:polyprenyl synthetase family protein n=1 Tax=Microbacterium karelineae TaxID=2654283 RepID=UPI0012EA3C32|nr:polyprenyl synthetase family protein [Microbacterium karelineae]
MSPAHAIISAISERLGNFARERREEVRRDEVFAGEVEDDPVAALLLDHATQALVGGKRLRARFAYWGWRAATRTPGVPPAHVIDLGAALEVFQAAALVHDDIVDNSDTRRGRPSTWRALEAAHGERGWSGSGEAFGRSGAILLGDLLLGWSDDLFEGALVDAEDAAETRELYARMRRDVILGQFLDIAEEAAWPTLPDAAHADRALRIAALKSARYSVQQPLLIGAALGGADTEVRDALAEFGPPLGLAFQLRDDVLGAFGDPAVTGKPSGDDLREGKRTLLVAYAREGMDPEARERFDGRLGADDLTDAEVAGLQSVVRASGALERVEQIIAAQTRSAEGALSRADLDDTTALELRALLEAATARAS